MFKLAIQSIFVDGLQHEAGRTSREANATAGLGCRCQKRACFFSGINERILWGPVSTRKTKVRSDNPYGDLRSRGLRIVGQRKQEQSRRELLRCR